MIDQSIFRNYDIRAEYGTALTEDAAYRVAHAYVEFAAPKTVIVGMDARVSSPSLKESVVKGLRERGVGVIDIGLVSTDAAYFAAWFYGYDGAIMITASHMPKQFNGLKFLRLDDGVLVPIGMGLGMEELRDLANREDIVQVQEHGSVEEKDMWPDFVTFVRSFVDIDAIKPFNVVMDAGNGMGGYVGEKVFAGMSLKRTDLFFEPDGTFPNHSPNPIIPKNREDIIAKVKEIGADLGVAWDADCDRVYFIDEHGKYVDGDFVTALLGKVFVEKNPGAAVVYDIRASNVVKDTIEAAGGVAHRERVGHTYIKHKMREVEAVFAGEVSGHYYFAANKYMDSGFIPALMIMEMMSKTGKTLSQIIADLGDYHVSGEINFRINEKPEDIYARMRETFVNAQEDLMDGLSMNFDMWRFNVRPSANDPVLRLNMEASSNEMLQEKLANVKEVIGGEEV